MAFDINNFVNKINSFSGTSTKKINSLNKTLTVVIEAGDLAPAGYGTFVIFGANVYGFNTNAGSTSGITIDVKESSHSQVKRETASVPYIIENILWSTSNNDNLENNLFYASRQATGLINQEQVQPLNYAEPEFYYSTKRNIRIQDFNELAIDGDHAITGRIEGRSTITLIINLKAKIDRSNLLDGDQLVNVAEPSKRNPIKVDLIGPDNNINCNKYNA